MRFKMIILRSAKSIVSGQYRTKNKNLGTLRIRPGLRSWWMIFITNITDVMSLMIGLKWILRLSHVVANLEKMRNEISHSLAVLWFDSCKGFLFESKLQLETHISIWYFTVHSSSFHVPGRILTSVFYVICESAQFLYNIWLRLISYLSYYTCQYFLCAIYLS